MQSQEAKAVYLTEHRKKGLRATQVTVGVAVRRSRNYNSAEVSASVTIDVDPGDNLQATITRTRAYLQRIVSSEAESAISETSHYASMDHE